MVVGKVNLIAHDTIREEVAYDLPVCGRHLRSPIPPQWTTLERDTRDQKRLDNCLEADGAETGIEVDVHRGA